MNIKVTNPIIEEKNLEEIKIALQSLIGYDVMIMRKQDCTSDNNVYVEPERLKIISYTKNFAIGENPRGFKECIPYRDIYSKQLIYEVVGR